MAGGGRCGFYQWGWWWWCCCCCRRRAAPPCSSATIWVPAPPSPFLSSLCSLSMFFSNTLALPPSHSALSSAASAMFFNYVCNLLQQMLVRHLGAPQAAAFLPGGDGVASCCTAVRWRRPLLHCRSLAAAPACHSLPAAPGALFSGLQVAPGSARPVHPLQPRAWGPFSPWRGALSIPPSAAYVGRLTAGPLGAGHLVIPLPPPRSSPPPHPYQS